MPEQYFNYSHKVAFGFWDRRSFISNWWRIYSGDPNWVPPYFPAFRRALNPTSNPYLAQQSFWPVSGAANRRPGRGEARVGYRPLLLEGAAFDNPVFAALVTCHPGMPRTAYLSWLHCVNDVEVLDHLLSVLSKEMRGSDCRQIQAPTGPVPHLGSGALLNYWNRIPPLHTAYHPPYLPEILGRLMEPAFETVLYQVEVPESPIRAKIGPAQLIPFSAQRLSQDLLPLLQSAFPLEADLPPLDAAGAAFLIRWLSHFPLQTWLLKLKDQPVGFALLGPDLAQTLKAARGGKNPLLRLWWEWAKTRPVRAGRLFFCGVIPEQRRQGLGSILLQHVLQIGAASGWRTISLGPLPADSQGAKLMEKRGARPMQRYRLYRSEIRPVYY